jgi:hypothetical protein
VYVIQFYFNKFSYRFRKACDSDPAPYDGLNRAVNTLPRLKDDDESEYNAKWMRYLVALTEAGFNAEVSKRKADRILSLRDDASFTIYNDDPEDEDGEGVDIIPVQRLKRYVQALKRLGWEDQGYTMYFCFYHNPTLGIPIARPSKITADILTAYRASIGRQPMRKAAAKQRAANFAGTGGKGGRRRRKRTKKRALKKKHRRTKRKRKRKTRRKRRGGKHKKKLSRGHCKKLRHQHRQLAHGLHRVSQAINVQCGMHGHHH